ncbi:MAG: GNAT family N-acetyltransferase [Pseudomonadota bacterium]
MIETERLILREIDPEQDFGAWARAVADADTVRYLGTEPLDRAKAWRQMAMVMGHWQIRGFGFFSVIEKATGAWVGRTGPWNPEGWPEPEVGWLTSPDHLRQGFAREAAQASVNYAFNTLGWERVIHVILDGNKASMATAESIGSRYLRTCEGLAGVTDGTIHIYGQENPRSA